MTDAEQLPGVADRRKRMLSQVLLRRFTRVTDLSEEFGVSSVTVRGDLDALEGAGLIRRIRGGAMPVDGSLLRELPFEQARVEAADEKARIAAAAVDQLESGMSILLDVGTTTAAIARELLQRDELTGLTVITSGLTIALALEPAVPRLQVVVTGGTLRPLQHSLVAPLADAVLDRLRPDVAFIGCNGVDAQAGVTNINLPEADVKRAMIAASSRTVVVADGSKIGRIHVGRIADASDVDLIITDQTAPEAPVVELRELGGPRLLLV